MSSTGGCVWAIPPAARNLAWYAAFTALQSVRSVCVSSGFHVHQRKGFHDVGRIMPSVLYDNLISAVKCMSGVWGEAE